MSMLPDDFLWFARIGNLELFQKAFLEDSTLVNSKDENDNTVLHMASANGHINLVLVILSHYEFGHLVNSENLQGNTPLHWAVLNKNYDVVSALVKCGANFFYENSFNETPIDVAVKLEDTVALELFGKLTVDLSQEVHK